MIARNDEWIAKNRLDAQRWCEDNRHRFNMDAPFDQIRLSFALHKLYLVLALSYPAKIRKGNVAAPIEFNVAPYEFVTERERVITILEDLKKAGEKICVAEKCHF